jgi:hypothetical protein
MDLSKNFAAFAYSPFSRHFFGTREKTVRNRLRSE